MINSRTLFVIGLVAVMVLSTAFGIPASRRGTWCTDAAQSRFVKIADESFSAQTVHTGDDNYSQG